MDFFLPDEPEPANREGPPLKVARRTACKAKANPPSAAPAASPTPAAAPVEPPAQLLPPPELPQASLPATLPADEEELELARQLARLHEEEELLQRRLEVKANMKKQLEAAQDRVAKLRRGLAHEDLSNQLPPAPKPKSEASKVSEVESPPPATPTPTAKEPVKPPVKCEPALAAVQTQATPQQKSTASTPTSAPSSTADANGDTEAGLFQLAS